MSTQTVRLSSTLTAFYRTVFPVLFVALFPVLVVTVVRHGRVVEVAPALVCGALLGHQILFVVRRMRSVELTGETLRVGARSGIVEIPLRDVADVRENRWINIRPITLVLRQPGPLGSSIVFMPASRLGGFWSDLPIATMLRERVAAAHGTP